MELIHSLSTSQPLSLSKIRGGRERNDTLCASDKELLDNLSEAFTIIHGGNFKKRKQSA